MKALLRNPGETVTEDAGIPGIEWGTGYPLTSPGWVGGPYRLVDNYVEVSDGAIYDVAVYPEPEEPTPARLKAKGAVQAVPALAPAAAPVTEDQVQDTIVIDGKKYSKQELRSLLE